VILLGPGACRQVTLAPPRPNAVPRSAIWIGGADGGAWCDCRPRKVASVSDRLRCSFWTDAGDSWASGVYRPVGVAPGTRLTDANVFDGEALVFAGGGYLEVNP
jgi:hypothetical protein